VAEITAADSGKTVGRLGGGTRGEGGGRSPRQFPSPGKLVPLVSVLPAQGTQVEPGEAAEGGAGAGQPHCVLRQPWKAPLSLPLLQTVGTQASWASRQ
jgi:hypothetical protein